MDALWPDIGDKVTFRCSVYVPSRLEERFTTARNGVFVTWFAKDGDPLALVQTEHGEVKVRWSIIEGIESPEGLLDSSW
ncbi:MAG: hypothetical protein JWN04_6917 [Myxococcaceae bacterium]|nr:hypothetical protein [Myxococcaceae bacterium]